MNSVKAVAGTLISVSGCRRQRARPGRTASGAGAGGRWGAPPPRRPRRPSRGRRAPGRRGSDAAMRRVAHGSHSRVGMLGFCSTGSMWLGVTTSPLNRFGSSSTIFLSGASKEGRTQWVTARRTPTKAAASGVPVAEPMGSGGHANPVAVLRLQHPTEDRDRAIADALAALATSEIARLPVSARARSAHAAASGPSAAGAEPILSWADGSHPQRDSNPCFRLERAMSWATRRWGPVVAVEASGEDVSRRAAPRRA